MNKILLIDDDFDDREFFEMALKELDIPHQLVQAENGQEAFEIILNEAFPKPDLIFVDLNMPKIDGRQFLTSIKKIPSYKNIPVIIYSTSSDPREIDACTSLGASGFITKPYSHRVLSSELKRVLLRSYVI